MISIITAWRNHPELLPDYARAIDGAYPIIIDNASDKETENLLREFTSKRGMYYRNSENQPFGKSNNIGLTAINSGMIQGGIVICLNNDVKAKDSSWLKQAEKDITRRALYGPALAVRTVARQPLAYLEGWCVGALFETWKELGGWDEWPHSYWEDNALSFRAIGRGIPLIETHWDIQHIGNYTSAKEPGAYDGSRANEYLFGQMVKNAQA